MELFPAHPNSHIISTKKYWGLPLHSHIQAEKMQEFNSQNFRGICGFTYFREALSTFTLKSKKLQKILKTDLKRGILTRLDSYKEKTLKTFKKEK